MSGKDSASSIRSALKIRFGINIPVDESLQGLEELVSLANRKVHRQYQDRDIEPELLNLLCASALSAPSKSDLQQADILIVKDSEKRHILAELLPDQTWLRTAPVVLVFLANGRRLVEISKLRNKPFPNNHLDLFFNASVDAGILLSTFMRAADAVGLGTCPISAIRDHSEAVSEVFELPERVIPVAGMCLGWPKTDGRVSPRLSLECTLHRDRYDEGNLAENLRAFDIRRAATHPLKARSPDDWEEVEDYGWCEDKARQFGVPRCADFGEFVRKKGFNLD